MRETVASYLTSSMPSQAYWATCHLSANLLGLVHHHYRDKMCRLGLYLILTLALFHRLCILLLSFSLFSSSDLGSLAGCKAEGRVSLSTAADIRIIHSIKAPNCSLSIEAYAAIDSPVGEPPQAQLAQQRCEGAHLRRP